MSKLLSYKEYLFELDSNKDDISDDREILIPNFNTM